LTTKVEPTKVATIGVTNQTAKTDKTVDKILAKAGIGQSVAKDKEIVVSMVPIQTELERSATFFLNEMKVKGHKIVVNINVAGRTAFCPGHFDITNAWRDSNGNQMHQLNIAATKLNQGALEIYTYMHHACEELKLSIMGVQFVNKTNRRHGKAWKDYITANPNLFFPEIEPGIRGWDHYSFKDEYVKHLIKNLGINEEVFNMARVSLISAKVAKKAIKATTEKPDVNGAKPADEIKQVPEKKDKNLPVYSCGHHKIPLSKGAAKHFKIIAACGNPFKLVK
jgi:hypothetical protein